MWKREINGRNFKYVGDVAFIKSCEGRVPNKRREMQHGRLSGFQTAFPGRKEPNLSEPQARVSDHPEPDVHADASSSTRLRSHQESRT